MLLASHRQNEEPTQAGCSVTIEHCSPMAARTETSFTQLSAKLRQRSGVDYQSSVDVDNPVLIDHIANPKWKHGQLCWEAKGRCAEDYKSIETELLKELNQSRRESFNEVAISLFMIGKTPQKAKPMIIISSEDKRSREEAKRAIIRSGVLEGLNYKIGFLKYLPSGPIHSVAGSSSEMFDVYTADPSFRSPGASDSNFRESGTYTVYPSFWSPAASNSNPREDTTSSSSNQPGFAVSSLAYYNPEQRLRTTAMPIYVKTAADRSRTATANMVYNGTVYKYITVSHVFSPWGASSIDSGEDDLGIPFDSDSEDEDHCNSETSQARSTISASLRVPTSRDSDIDSAKSHRSKISTRHNDSPDTAKDPPSELLKLGELSADDDFDKSADYAIITINDFRLQKQLANLAISNSNRITHIHAAEPKSSQVTAWTRRGAISGTLGNVPRIMRFSGSKRFQRIYEFAYEGVIEDGDSGSLVYDESGKELYGMIIAASNSQSVAYIMAAKELIPSIKNAGDWRFMSPGDDHTNINQSHETKSPSHSQTTYDRMSAQITHAEPTWDHEYQRYFHTVWDARYKMYYRTHYVEGQYSLPLADTSAHPHLGQGWVFFDWLQVGLDNRPRMELEVGGARMDSVYHSDQIAGAASMMIREGAPVRGSYDTNNPVSYEPLDQSKHCTISIEKQN
jgi:hypothetical protein